MKRITSLVPRKSDVQLGNRIFLVGEMRLLDLADLQTFLDDQWKDPLKALGGSLRHLEGRERRKVLADIWDACEEGPPTWGTHRASKALMEPEGIVKTFSVILGQHASELVDRKWVPLDMDRENIISIAEATGNHPDGWDQYRGMMSAWQPVEAIEELAFMMGMDEIGPQGKPITYVEAVVTTCEAMNWSIDYVMGLTMRQFKAVRSGGKPREYGQPVRPKTNLAQVVKETLARIASDEEQAKSLKDKGNSHG